MSLQGTLRTLGIAEVLEFLAGRKATGRLEITSDSGHATYWVLGGEICSVDYSFAREAGTDAAEATYYALAELEGTFLFDEDQRPEPGAETESISDVLSRTADNADGWSFVEEVVPTQQNWLTRSERLEDAVTVLPEWWEAIAAVADGITPQALAHSLDMRALATSTMASEMVRAGLLQVGDQVVAPAPEADDAAQPETPVEDPLEPHASSVETHAETVDAGLHLFGGGEAQEAPQDDQVPHLAVVHPSEDPQPAEPVMADESFSAEPPASPALVWDVTNPAPVAAEESSFSDEQAFTTSPNDMPAEPAFAESGVPEANDEHDEDDGWASDHSQPAPVSMGAYADSMQTAPPSTADVFGAAAPAAPAASSMAPMTEDAQAEAAAADDSTDYAGDDRSSVLKFLRRD